MWYYQIALEVCPNSLGRYDGLYFLPFSHSFYTFLLLACIFRRNTRHSVKMRKTDGNFKYSLFLKTCMNVMLVVQAMEVLSVLCGSSLTLSIYLSLFLYHSVIRPFLSRWEKRLNVVWRAQISLCLWKLNLRQTTLTSRLHTIK